MVLNGQPVSTGTWMLRPRDGDGWWVPQRELADWRLTARHALSMEHAGQGFVPLSAVSGLTYALDGPSQSLLIQAPGSAFAAITLDAAEPALPEIRKAPLGVYLNYDIQAQHQNGDTRLAGFGEWMGFGGWGLARSSALADQSPGGGRLVRLETAWLRDDPGRATRWQLGDGILRSGTLSRSRRFSGLQFGRRFETQPHVRRFPVPVLKGEVDLPSTVELYINGLRRSQASVPPGPFTFDSPPLVSGVGDAVIQVTDALGRTRRLEQPFFVNAELLRPGFKDFSFGVGVLRDEFGVRSHEYSGMVGNAIWRQGVTTHLTAEVNAQWHDDLGVMGLAAALTPGFPVSLNLGIGAGFHGGDSAPLAVLGARYQGRRFSLEGRYEAAGADFAGFGAFAAQSYARRQSVVNAGMRWRGLGLRALYLGRLQQTGDRFELVSLGLSRGLPIGGVVSLEVFQRRGSQPEDHDTGLRALLTVPLGRRGSASYTGESADSGQRQVLQWQRSPPAGVGQGYRARLQQDQEVDRLLLGGLHHAETFILEAGLDRADAQSAWRLGAAGALGAMAGRWFASRPLRQSFALVELPGVAGAGIFRDNRQVARTDARGVAVVTDLRAYDRNRLRVDTAQLPLDRRWHEAEQSLAPAFRAGALVSFDAAGGAGVVRLIQPDLQPVPIGAKVSYYLDQEKFPVGRQGLTYLERLAPGRNRLVAHWPGASCAFEVNYAPGGDPLPDLGRVACREA